jgi:IS5 family transposase
LKIIKDYESKYNGIDRILENNLGILDAFHNDLKDFGSTNGRESKFSSEQIMRLAIVKCIEGDPYRETIIRVNGSDFLRNFTRIGMGEVPGYTFFCEATKCIRPETLKAMNALLLQYGKDKDLVSGKSLRVDSTVCESNIHYPTDVHLLWDGYRVLARLMIQAKKADWRLDCGNRIHIKKAKSLFTFVSTHGGKKNKSTKRKVDKKMRTLMERVDWIVESARRFSKHAYDVGCNSIAAYGIVGEIERMIPKVAWVVRQAQRAWINGETVPAAERIFSIFEDHTELLMRGKTRQPIEFGHLVTLGQTQEKFISYYTVEERSRHDSVHKDEVLADHKKSFDVYPQRFTADKNYHVSPEDTREWEKKIGLYAVCKKGNRTVDEEHREHTEEFRLAQRFRAGCEGSISVLKRAFGLKRVLNRGFTSFAAAIGCLVFCHNLVLLAQT